MCTQQQMKATDFVQDSILRHVLDTFMDQMGSDGGIVLVSDLLAIYLADMEDNERSADVMFRATCLISFLARLGDFWHRQRRKSSLSLSDLD